MTKVKFNLRKVVAIAICLTVTTMFSGCKDKEVIQLPTCTITSPTNNAEFSMTENITIAVTADVKGGTIAEVRLYVDNAGHSSVSTFPYNFTLNAGVLTPGSHTLRAEAIDYHGEKGVSTVINITVKPLTIGMTYQGGKIAYIDPTGLHGLIVAPEDQSTGIQWHNGANIATGATGTAIGTGKGNTDKIVQVQGVGNYAAKICDDLVLGGYDDWFLPSKDELIELVKNRTEIGLTANTSYWSSSEISISTACDHTTYGNDSPSETYKSVNLRVRAVRKF